MIFKAMAVDYWDRVLIALCDDASTDKVRYYAKPAIIDMARSEDGIIGEPFLQLDMPTAVSLANALYQAGVRPTIKQPEDISAIKYHLEDMRALVFKGKKKIEVLR